MSEFHYVRTPGTDGGVDDAEGPAIGLDLETVLQSGLPPWNVAMEIIAALCEILDIADEDTQVHGDITPKVVFIDETGAVSLEGFGIERQATPSPEGVPKGTSTDLYGLGYTALRTISSQPLPHPMPRGEDIEELVIDAALAIDLSQLRDEMQGDVQWFVAKLMSSVPEERPKALEAWRTFIAFANELEGPDIAEWCAAALDGGGARRQEGALGSAPAAEPVSVPAEAAPPVPKEEELGGPVVQRGPLASEIRFDDGGSSSRAGATAFWTRKDIKKALDRAAVVDAEEGPPMGIGGGSATSFWTRAQLDAMARGDDAAPRPKRAAGEGARRMANTPHRHHQAPAPDTVRRDLDINHPNETSFQPRPVAKPPSDALVPPPGQGVGSAEPPGQEKTVAKPESTPSVKPARPQPAVAKAPPAVVPPPVEPTPDEPARQGGGLTFVLFGGGVAAFGVGISLLLVVVVVVVAVVMSRDTETVEPLPRPQQERTDVQPTPKPPPTPRVERPKPRPERPKPPPSPTPAPVVDPAPPNPAPRVTPQPSPRLSTDPFATTDARVQLTSTGAGSISGCQNDTLKFDGRRTFSVEGYRLPATCLVVIDDARGVFQVFGSGRISCEKQGTEVVCNKKQVP